MAAKGRDIDMQWGHVAEALLHVGEYELAKSICDEEGKLVSVSVCVFLKDIQKVWGGCGFPLHTLSMLLRKASKLVKESKYCGIKNFIILKGIQFFIGCLYSPVIRGEPFQILASPQVSAPLISRPVGSYWEGGATPL